MQCDKVWLCRQLAEAINKDRLLAEQGIRAEYYDWDPTIFLYHVETNLPFGKLIFEEETKR